jgi:rhodanese-related sulfurtransferase/signal-transduction protein with cAMP-binding, CBS, and nucleotidyltransferase domain
MNDSVSPCLVNAAVHAPVKSTKLGRILDNLIQQPPFNQLSEERLTEVLNLVRLIEMRPGELFQVQGGKDNDYLFVIEGRIELIGQGEIRSGLTPEDTRKRPVMLPQAPATTTLLARERVTLCHADRQVMDDLISWEAMINDQASMDETVHARMEMVRNSLVFRRLPWEAVETAFQRMKSIPAKCGETVAQEGEPGDAFYIITSGRAEVWQNDLMTDEPKKIAEIGEGDAFGCEALISGKKRSETVRMLEDGTLLTLGKEDFDWLISKQMIKAVNAKVAHTMMETGYKFIDVRYREEYEYNRIPGAILIPLFELRKTVPQLDPSQRYIIYCQSGSRSSVAALRLTQAGFDVQTLEGGIREWTYETESSDT